MDKKLIYFFKVHDKEHLALYIKESKLSGPLAALHFYKNKKTIEFHGKETLQYWIENADRLATRIQPEKTMVAQIRQVFPIVPFVYSIRDFCEIYCGYGYDRESDVDVQTVENIDFASMIHNSDRDIDLGRGINKRCWINSWYYVIDGVEHAVLVAEFAEIMKSETETIRESKWMVIGKNYWYVQKGLSLRDVFSTDYFCHKRGLDIFYKLYPELMLEEYMNKGGRHPVRFLLSPYVNARIELLGKCGLGNFSDNFEDLPKANPFAAKAEDLFGVYKQTLRSMNDYHGKNLIIERGFCFIKMIQDYQPAIFEHELTYNSICFLKDYWDENGKRTRMYRSFSKRDVLRAVRFLNGQYLERGSDPEDYDSDDVIWMPYENFRDYQMMCEEMNCYPYGKFPRSTMEAHQAAVYQYIKMYRNDTDKAVEFHRKTTTYKYLKKCWADKKYEIIAPMVLEEMLKEGIEQCSCVASYIDFVLEGISQIYFMRKKDDPGHPLVTIEVRGNVIRQAYGFANRHLDFEEQDFMKRWADEKHLVIRCHGIYTIREYEDLTSMYQYEPMDQYELDLDDVIDMIEEGEDILQKTKSGRTPLFVAVENDDYEVAEYLLNNGASISESVLINGFGIFHESMLPWISPGIMMLLKLHDTDQKFQQICYNGKTPVEFAAGIASDLGQKESFLELDIEVEEEGDGQNEMG